jgi:hypothetical protein
VETELGEDEPEGVVRFLASDGMFKVFFSGLFRPLSSSDRPSTGISRITRL